MAESRTTAEARGTGRHGADARVPILVLNNVAPAGIARLPAVRYRCESDVTDPVAILLRSADLHAMPIADSVQAIARAGAGTNNIPVAAMSARGIPVFNAPGANANAVTELVVAAMLMAARNVPAALRYVADLDVDAPELEQRIEDGKKAFGGHELRGRTLGIVGLGRIGSLLADAAIRLGMQVAGFDPDITVEAAWSLSSQVRRADSVDDVLRTSDFVSLHVPLLAATRGLVGAANVDRLRPGAVLMNFSREGVVDDAAVVQALARGRLAHYVCDFPNATIARHPRITALPHLGASTVEAETQCAVMVADQLREYLENGNVTNSVNFPGIVMERGSPWRLIIANANVPNMLGAISTTLAGADLNIHNMLNKSRGNLACTLVDADSEVPPSVIAQLRAIEGVLKVRYVPANV